MKINSMLSKDVAVSEEKKEEGLTLTLAVPHMRKTVTDADPEGLVFQEGSLSFQLSAHHDQSPDINSPVQVESGPEVCLYYQNSFFFPQLHSLYVLF